MTLSMSRNFIFVFAALLLATTAFADDASKKHHPTRHWHGYGFLPGYRPPAMVARERYEHYYRLYGYQYYGPAWPGFYRGRWNAGGFGPCWTRTPIGPMWNCGR